MALNDNTEKINQLIQKINSLPNDSSGGGIILPDIENEGTESHLLLGKQLINSSGEVLTGTIPTKTTDDLYSVGNAVIVPEGYYEDTAIKEITKVTQATPSISVDSSGLITASSTQEVEGFVIAGTKTGTKQLTTQSAQTITPSTSNKTISSGRYLTGTQTIKGDENLVSENIKNGVSIFGVIGTYKPEDTGMELPVLTNEGNASHLLSGKQLISSTGDIVTGNIATKTSSNVTSSGATVTIPSGYYASQVTKSVSTVTRADTTISVSADDTNDRLTITASNDQESGYVTGGNKTATKTITLSASGSTVTASDGTNSVSRSVTTTTQATPTITVSSSGLITSTASQSAGYVSSGSKSATKQLATQSAKTITPSTSSQTAVSSGVYTTGNITVSAIPNTYVKPTVTKTATTYTPTTTPQTIAAGTYCSGLQTIKGDSNLVAGNIKSGVSIFGVNGSYSDAKTLAEHLQEEIIILSEGLHYGDTLPESGTKGRLFFLKKS